jgi:hypothetical protein
MRQLIACQSAKFQLRSNTHFIVQEHRIPNFLAAKAWLPNFNLGIIIYHPRKGQFKSPSCTVVQSNFNSGVIVRHLGTGNFKSSGTTWLLAKF